MESSVIPVSLNGRVLSQCHLGDTELSLLSTAGGFCLKWVDSLKEKEGTPVKSFTHFSNEIESCGRLHPVKLNEELQLAIFGRGYRSNSKERKSVDAALVVCDNGTVLAAHCKWSKVLPSLCHLTDRIVWAGIITSNNKTGIAVVSKVGIIHIALPPEGNGIPEETTNSSGTCKLHWQRETLTVTPLVCIGQNNVIFISDGYTSWLSVLKITKENKIEHKCSKLSYCGIIRITAVDNDNLDLFTCDGRMYKCEWKLLLEDIKKEKSVCKADDKQPSCTIEGVMTGIRNCSELMQIEGKCVQDLDAYIKQLTIATSLLVEPQKEIFVASVKVMQRLDQRNSYTALINLRKKSADIGLEGKWWQLNITVPGPNSKQTISVRTDDQQFTNDISVSVALPEININHSAINLKIVCHLIFGHYLTLHPICQILACHANVNVFHFLTPKHILNSTSICSADFNSAIQNMACKKIPNGYSQRVDYAPLPSCEVLLSFAANETNVQLFLELLNMNSASPSALVIDTNSNQVQLWYQDIPLNILYLQQDERLLVTFSGPNPSLVLSAKVAVEKCIAENGLASSRATIDAKAFQQAQQLHQILEFESAKATTVGAVGHLHYATAKMLSLLPL